MSRRTASSPAPILEAGATTHTVAVKVNLPRTARQRSISPEQVATYLAASLERLRAEHPELDWGFAYWASSLNS